jgi:hypothetical protein
MPSTDHNAIAAAGVDAVYPVYTHYINKQGDSVYLTERPEPGCVVVRTTLSRDDIVNPEMFKNPACIWRFALSVGRVYEGSTNAEGSH